jgi:hypothetical protein
MFRIPYLDKVFIILLRALEPEEKDRLSSEIEAMMNKRKPANDNDLGVTRDFLTD